MPITREMYMIEYHIPPASPAHMSEDEDNDSDELFICTAFSW
jgi:hypothetical protein